jgi:hypothetical protein
MNNNYKWNEYLLVQLKKRSYFDPINPSKEVELSSRLEIINKIGMNGTTKYYEDQKLLEEKILSTEFIAGACVEDTNKSLNIEPFYGLQEDKYFVIPKQYIKKIIRINRIRKDTKSDTNSEVYMIRQF